MGGGVEESESFDRVSSDDRVSIKKNKNDIFVADRPQPHPLTYAAKLFVGIVVTLNFVVFWALPIFGQGQLWRHFLKPFLRPIYQHFQQFKALRNFAATYVYGRPQYADYFVQSLFCFFSNVAMLCAAFYYQLNIGPLPIWFIFVYNCAWVGFGGRIMGGSYSFAHKEGHDTHFYSPFLRSTVGNIFENWLGPFNGILPYNFSTAHVAIHHKLNAGIGDTFYQWDFDRTSWHDLMLYLARILAYMLGSSLEYFQKQQNIKYFNKLLKGMVLYWVVYPAAILFVTRSLHFFFFIYLQPLICMTFFLAFMNFGFHGFIEFDENGRHIKCINATAILNGDDDFFGEDDHLSHHYSTRTFYRDLPALIDSQKTDFAKHHASIFQNTTIVELSALILFKQWDMVADLYVDFSGKLTKKEIVEMLKVRAQRIEVFVDEEKKAL